MLKNLWLALSAAALSLTLGLAPLQADAKRLGGGKPAGMQRQMPAKPADASPAPTPSPTQAAAAAAPAAVGAAAQAGRRSWLGPIAGIAAGLGLAALASHLGFGEELASFMLLALLAIVALVAVRWFLARRRGHAPQGGLAYAGAASAGQRPSAFERVDPAPVPPSNLAREALAPVSAGAAVAGGSSAAAWPGFDAAGFERIAKMIFIRLQAAHDAGDLDDLRKFTTPELFASLRVDLHDRGAETQRTDVVQLEAQVADLQRESDRQVVSVRFSGLIREVADGAAEPFAELWHLVRPLDESRDWQIAGIQPLD